MCKKSLVVKEFVNNISPDMDKHGNISQEEYDPVTASTAQKMKLSIKDSFSKCDQIRRILRIWSHLLRKSLMENFIFCAVYAEWFCTS